jgi:hypothetical protein
MAGPLEVNVLNKGSKRRYRSTYSQDYLDICVDLVPPARQFHLYLEEEYEFNHRESVN